jgi:hypothetical protein
LAQELVPQLAPLPVQSLDEEFSAVQQLVQAPALVSV